MSILNRCFNRLSKWLILLLILILSSCSTYHHYERPSSYEDLSQVHSQFAPIQNGKIEYYRFGHGSPIILIPGYITDISSWDRDFLSTLAEQHQVIVFNNRNVGGSIVRSSTYTSQDLANDTYQLIQELDLKKPAVLGISMGGMIAQQLAVLHPNKIGQLILINTAIAGKQAIHPDPVIEKELLDMPESKLGRYALAVKLFFPPSWRTRMAYALAVDRFQPQNYIEIDSATIKPQQRGLVLDWVNDNATAIKIHRLHLPVLILNGEADVVLPPFNSVILARTIPHAELIRWKEGGHAMIYQFPKEMADIVNCFIAETSCSNSYHRLLYQ